MEISHATYSESVLKILKKGILPPSSPLFDGTQNCMGFSSPDHVYLTAVDERDYSIVNNYMWGNFYFFLNVDWVKSNADQFRNMGYSFRPDFSKFMKELGIIDNKEIIGSKQSGQIISSKPIPLEAIEGFMLQGDPSLSSKLWQVYDNDLELIKGRKIHKTEYDNFIDLREFLPKGMGLYVGNNNETRRVN